MTDSNDLVRFSWVVEMMKDGSNSKAVLPSDIIVSEISNHPQYQVKMYSLLPYGRDIERDLNAALTIGDFFRISKVASSAEELTMDGFINIFEQPANRDLLKCFRKFGKVCILVKWYGAHELITIFRGRFEIRGMYLCDDSGYMHALLDWLFNQYTEEYKVRYLLDSLERGAYTNV